MRDFACLRTCFNQQEIFCIETKNCYWHTHIYSTGREKSILLRQSSGGKDNTESSLQPVLGCKRTGNSFEQWEAVEGEHQCRFGSVK